MMNPKDLEELQKAMQKLSKFAPIINAFLEKFPIDVKPIRIKDKDEKGNETTKEYLAILIEPPKPTEEKQHANSQV